jgi:hypothetical protein
MCLYPSYTEGISRKIEVQADPAKTGKTLPEK